MAWDKKFSHLCYRLQMSSPLIFQTLPSDVQTSIETIYDRIMSLVKSQGKSFTAADIYSMLSAIIVAVDEVFTDTTTETKVKYVVDIAVEVVTQLSRDNVIPAEVGTILALLPLGSIVEFLMKLLKAEPVVPSRHGKDVLPLLSVKHVTGIVPESEMDAIYG